ncbi:hypothetical protein LTR66_015071, partial [Elasticomyces elasticus]
GGLCRQSIRPCPQHRQQDPLRLAETPRSRPTEALWPLQAKHGGRRRRCANPTHRHFSRSRQGERQMGRMARPPRPYPHRSQTPLHLHPDRDDAQVRLLGPGRARTRVGAR